MQVKKASANEGGGFFAFRLKDEIIDFELDEEFETTIDQLSVELIGENEESNIIIQIKL